jgi:hypothetical protein
MALISEKVQMSFDAAKSKSECIICVCPDRIVPFIIRVRVVPEWSKRALTGGNWAYQYYFKFSRYYVVQRPRHRRIPRT